MHVKAAGRGAVVLAIIITMAASGAAVITMQAGRRTGNARQKSTKQNGRSKSCIRS
jgi:hypothetical protein